MQFGSRSKTTKKLLPSKSGKLKKNRSALNSGLRLLARRPYSEKEVYDHLIRHWPEADVVAAIAKLKELKFIDDEAFATWYKQSRLRARPMSGKLLTLELKRKGIKTVVESDDRQSAEKALAKKKHLTWKQAMRFLASRGFSWEVIETVLKKRYNNDNVNY